MATKKIDELLAEDIGYGDLTSESLSSEVMARGRIVCKSSGVLAGVEEACYALRKMGATKIEVRKRDGERVKPGDIVLEVEGPAKGILAAERTALNLLMWMSGTATATAEMVEKARAVNGRIVVASTRKSPFPYFDKKAVQAGGGDPHRFRLDDCVLLKSNHLRLYGGLQRAIESLRKSFTKKVEVEVKNAEEALEAARLGADIIMLDNVPAEEVRRTVKVLEESGLRDKVILEVSGGITPSNIQEYAQAGPDVISSSYMTMSAPALDFSLELFPLL